MNFSISECATRNITRLKKNEPQILVYSGVLGCIIGTVVACKATMKLREVLDDHNRRIEAIRRQNDPDTERAKLTKAYGLTVAKLSKLYGPAAAIEILSIFGILRSNNLLRKRNVALVMAYTALDKSFRKYRERVIETYGEEADEKLRLGTKKVEIEETVADAKGKEKKIKKSVDVASDLPSPYAIYFAYGEAAAAEPNMDYNLSFLHCQNAIAEHMLVAREEVHLNEIYDLLGAKRSKAGEVVGWVYDKKNPRGDNRIIFDIRKVWRKKSDGSGKLEEVLVVDFNVDGVITDHCIEKGLLAE